MNTKYSSYLQILNAEIETMQLRQIKTQDVDIDEEEDENPVVEGAWVQCSAALNPNAKVYATISSISGYDSRNGNLALRNTDITFFPSTFGMCKCQNRYCMPLIEGMWKSVNPYNTLTGCPSIMMISYMVCYRGNGMITLKTDGQEAGEENIQSVEEAYEIMNSWLLGGFSSVSKEILLKAMNYLAEYGEQNSIKAFINTRNMKPVNNLEKDIFQRINSSIQREKQYENMILAWTNYWNINMEKEYGENNYSPIRAEVVKAMLVVESNMGEAGTEDKVLANSARDIKQSLDCRNPVFWTVLDEYGSGRTITISYSQEDKKRFANLGQSKTITIGKMSDGGPGQRLFFGNGTWGAVREVISEDYSTYYADNVTPELSLAVGLGNYCLQLNGAGTNGGQSLMRSEYQAVYNYNGEGDPHYIDKVNIVLENMGVDKVENN